MNYLELWDDKSEELWKRFIEMDGISTNFTPSSFKEEMKKEHARIFSVLQSGYLQCPTIGDKGGTTNYFIIHDVAYGGACEKCDSDGIVLLIMDQEYVKNMDDKIFLPSIESYHTKGVSPVSDRFMNQFPIPVNYKTDYWYCPNCEELHRFSYDQELSLMYNQDIV